MGQAKARGTFEERRLQALQEGRTKVLRKKDLPLTPEDLTKLLKLLQRNPFARSMQDALEWVIPCSRLISW